MKWKDRDMKTWMVVGGILPLLVLGILAEEAWSAKAKCFDCHRDESLSKQDASGKTVSLFVSEAGFKNSVHGTLSCSDCHTKITDDSHAEGGKKAADRRVNCESCHDKAEKEYKQGLHSKMIMKERRHRLAVTAGGEVAQRGLRRVGQIQDELSHGGSDARRPRIGPAAWSQCDVAYCITLME